MTYFYVFVAFMAALFALTRSTTTASLLVFGFTILIGMVGLQGMLNSWQHAIVAGAGATAGFLLYKWEMRPRVIITNRVTRKRA